MDTYRYPKILEEFLSDTRLTNLRTCDRSRQSLHVAIIVKRGKILATATNRNGSRSGGSGYSSHSIHAEKNVIKELGDITKLRDADLYVMRISTYHQNSKTDEPVTRFIYSRPCTECRPFLEKCMREYGLRNVYYTG